MTFKYRCLPFRQSESSPRICVFHAPASEVLRWAAIERLPERERGPQRRLTGYKASAIQRFLADSRNCIPTAITVAIRPGVKPLRLASGEPWTDSQPGDAILCLGLDSKVADADKPAVVIDGQHRLHGVAQRDGALHVTVVALIDASDIEIAFQFLVINNKSSRVSPDHIRSLVAEYDKSELEARLRGARLTQYPNLEYVTFADADPESPFRELVRWPSNRSGTQVVPPAAIESAIAAIQQKELDLFRDPDAVCAFFFAIWTVIKETWPDLWAESCQEGAPAVRKRLLDKIGIVCLTQFFVDALVQLADLGMLNLADPEDVRGRVVDMIQYQAKELWQQEWVSASYDTKAGRSAVVEALVRVGRNLRRGVPWYEEVKLLDPGSIERGPVEE